MVLWRMIRGVFAGIWRLLSGLSKVVSVLLPLVALGFLATGIYVGMQGAVPEPVPEKTALLINPAGFIVENRTPLEPVEAFMQGDAGEVLLQDLVDAIERAAQDDRVTALVLDLQGLAGPSVSQTMELRAAIDRFRESSKPVVAVGDYFDQSQYLLASQADHVLMHPKGMLELTGFGVYHSYMRQLLQNTMVTMNVFRVGENKSAVEPFLRDDMSASEREVVGRWLGKLWQQYTELVESSRGLASGFLDQFIAEFPDRLEIAGGDGAQLALDAGLVDELLYHDGQERFIAELVGATGEDGGYMAVDFNQYLIAEPFEPTAVPESTDAKPVIAVVPIEGELIPGESLSGFAGSDTVVEQLANAASLNNVVAVVLRINSPGGSVFASEVIRQKVLDLKAQGLPVLVSMGGVAASGGYYIAADADEIWALPGTITGSIGVFAAFPTVEKLYDWAGVNVDGVATTPMAKAIRFDTGVDDNGRRIINSYISRVYQDFVGLVAQGRGMTWDAVNAIAGGKVWAGVDARDIGLVDELGALGDVVVAAAARVEVEDWDVIQVGNPISPEQMFLQQLGRNLGQAAFPGHSAVMNFAAKLAAPLRVMDSLQDPANLYVRCLECTAGI